MHETRYINRRLYLFIFTSIQNIVSAISCMRACSYRAGISALPNAELVVTIYCD